MDTTTLIDPIAPDDVQALVSRREAIARGAKTSAFVKMALASASVPVALAALSQEVYGQAPAATVTSVLQFALLLENLEAEFYKTVTGGGTGFSAANNPQAAAFAPVRAQITGAALATLTLIRDHEIAHVALLRTALGAAAPAPLNGTAFDFTGGGPSARGNGPFIAAATNLDYLLAITQGFEDTGVRAYKGQAGNLFRTTTLQTALQIHAMEARHASRIRRIRRARAAANTDVRLSGTVRGGLAPAAGVGTITGVPAASLTAATNAFNLIYGPGASATTSPSEANVTQGGVDLTATASAFGGANAVTEAFDEPLARADIVAIVQPFVVATVS